MRAHTISRSRQTASRCRAREAFACAARRDARGSCRPGSTQPEPAAPTGRSATELARLIPLWPSELADMSAEGRALLVAKLARALRAERQRGLAGHWTYDLARHAELLNAYRALKLAPHGGPSVPRSSRARD